MAVLMLTKPLYKLGILNRSIGQCMSAVTEIQILSTPPVSKTYRYKYVYVVAWEVECHRYILFMLFCRTSNNNNNNNNGYF